MNRLRHFAEHSRDKLIPFLFINSILLPIIPILIAGYSFFSSGTLRSERPFIFPDLIDYDSKGNIYLSEDGWKRVSKIRPDGTVAYSLSGGSRDSGFYEAWQISVNSKGHLFLLNSVRDLDGSYTNREEIQEYDEDGTYLRSLKTFTHTKEEALDTANFIYGRIVSMNVSNGMLYYLFREKETVSVFRSIEIGTGKENALFRVPNNEDIIDFQPYQDGFLITKKNGELVFLKPDGSKTVSTSLQFSGTPLLTPHSLSVTGNTIFVTDYGNLSMVRAAGGSCTPILSQSILESEGISPSKSLFRNVASRNDGSAISVDEINRRIIGTDPDGKIRFVLNNAKYSPRHRALVLLYILLFATVPCIIFFDIFFIYRVALNGRLSLLAKQFICFIILFGVSMTIIAIVIYKATSERHESEYSNKLRLAAQIASQTIDGDTLEKINSPRDFGGTGYLKLQNQMWKQINAKTHELGRNLYSVLYKKHGDSFYYTVDLYSYYGTMYPYTMSIPAHEEAYRDGVVGSSQYTDIEGDWIIGVAPVFNSKGKIVGVYEIGTSLYIVDEIKKLFYTKLAIIVIIASLIQLIIFYAAYYYLFRSLRELKKATAMIRKGNHDVIITVNTGDEIEDLADGINEMTARIRSYIKELEEKNTALLAIDKIKDEFLANTSHELRTPLNGIIGITESFMDGDLGSLTELQNHYMNLVLRSSRRLSSLVNDILDFSKMQHHDMPVNITPVDVKHTINIITALSRAGIKRKPVTIEDNTGDIPYLYTDNLRLEQILHNLIGNAVKFTERGKIQITSNITGNQVEISIVDTGIGIPKSKMDTIFKPFEQVDGSLTRHYGGTGLGLPITKKLVELLGGTLSVESAEGTGSTFTFTLSLPVKPITKEELDRIDTGQYTHRDMFFDSDKSLPVPEIPRNGAQHTILVVDDDRINLDALAHMLSVRGFHPVAIDSSEEALRRIQGGEAFDCAIIDVMMPVVSGYDLVRAIRVRHPMIELPVILLTAKSRSIDVVDGFESGANDYLVKPINKRELFARLDTVLLLKQAAKENARLTSIERELKIAKSIQDSILPASITGLNRLDIATAFIPAETVAGDFFDFHKKSGDEIGILISDVTGHGISAALVASMIKIAFYFQRHLMEKPGELLAALNESLTGSFRQGYLTAFYFYIDTNKMIMRLARAGHPPLIVYRTDTDELIELRPKGRIIGCFEDTASETVEFALRANDIIIAYTDGITEARNPAGEMFGEELFHAAIRIASGKKTATIRDTIIDSVNSFRGKNETVEDDITLIVCRVIPD